MLNIVGYFAGELGLGVVARNLALAVAAKGIPPACSVFSAGTSRDRVVPPIPLPPPGQIDLRYGSTLLVCGAMPDSGMAQAAQIVRGRTRLAILAYWELTELPPEAVQFLSQADLIFAGSPFTRDVFQRYFPAKPCHVIASPIDLQLPATPPSRRDYGLPEDRPLLLTSFEPMSDTRRKNAEGAIEAFLRSADRHDGMLVLKVNWPVDVEKDHPLEIYRGARELIERYRGHPRIIVRDESIPYDRLLGLFSCVDAVISLHRAEGLGLVMLEAMSLGVPVIATGYSGNLAFMERGHPGLVPYRLVPAAGLYAFYDAAHYAVAPLWAEPDLDAAAERIARVLADRDYAELLRSEGARQARNYQAHALQADWLRHVVNFAIPRPLTSYASLFS